MVTWLQYIYNYNTFIIKINGKSHNHLQVEDKLKHEADKYRAKIEEEVRKGARGSGYSAIRKLGQRPGEEASKEFVIQSHAEAGLTAEQSTERLADHFSEICRETGRGQSSSCPSAGSTRWKDKERQACPHSA